MIPLLPSFALVLCVPSQLRDGADPVQFVDEAAARGVDVVGFGRGSAMCDLDGDGLLDIVATNAGHDTWYFRQLPSGSFQEMTSAWGMPQDTKQTWGVLAADFDGDGDVDLYFPCGAFSGPEQNRFLRNDLDTLGTFTDVTAASGDAGSLVESNFGGAVLDYDRDGDLDIFLSSTQPYQNTTPVRNTLLRNDGSLVFTDVSAQAGIVELGNFKHCGAADYDADGWVDIGVGDYSGRPLLYRNLGNGTFEEVGLQAGLDDPNLNFGFVFDEFDGDGRMDVLLPKYVHGANSGSTTTKVYLNNGDGTFRDVSAGSGLGGQEDMGHNTADFNGDGFADYLSGTGHPFNESPDYLYMIRPNLGNGIRVLDLSSYSGIRGNGWTRGHGTPVGDLDGNGFLDFFLDAGGPASMSGTAERSALWMNQGNGNAWVAFELVGVVSNREGIGAVAHVRLENGRLVTAHRAVGKGFCNTDAPRLHFGLGNTHRAEKLEIHWPSGIVQTILDFTPRQVHRIEEAGILSDDLMQIGGSVTVDACGPAGFQVDLYGSENTANRIAPGLGGLALLAPPVRLLGSVTLGSDGRGAIVVQVPNNPNLIGRNYHMQGRLLDPSSSARDMLTNRLDFVVQ